MIPRRYLNTENLEVARFIKISKFLDILIILQNLGEKMVE